MPNPILFVSRQLKANGLVIKFLFSYHLKGGFGYDFSSNVDKLEEALKHVAKGILEHGVTSFCPTLVTSASEVYKMVCAIFDMIILPDFIMFASVKPVCI